MAAMLAAGVVVCTGRAGDFGGGHVKMTEAESLKLAKGGR